MGTAEMWIVGLVVIILIVSIVIYVIISKALKRRCCNGGNQHKFKPRYSEKRNDYSVGSSGGFSANDLKKLITEYKYVKDVCIWCGKEIKK